MLTIGPWKTKFGGQLTSSLNSASYLFMKPLEVRPTSGGQFKTGVVQRLMRSWL